MIDHSSQATQYQENKCIRYMQVFLFSLILTFSQTAFVMAEGLVLCERDTPKGERLSWSTDSIAFSIENKRAKTVKYTVANYEQDNTISHEYSNMISCNTKIANNPYVSDIYVALCVSEEKEDDGGLSIVGVSASKNAVIKGFPVKNMPQKMVTIKISFFDKSVFQGAITDIEVLQTAGHFFNCY